jgi:hypothetical protein
MATAIVMQGRMLEGSDLGMIRGLLDAHPDWNRTRLSPGTVRALGLA